VLGIDVKLTVAPDRDAEAISVLDAEVPMIVHALDPVRIN
jgi:hypothetical protein